MQLPVSFNRPVPCSDALWDLHITHSHWMNFVGGSLLAAETLFVPKTIGSVHRPTLKIRSLQNHIEAVPVPEIEVVAGKWNVLVEELPRQLYYAAFVRLATAFEEFLVMLLEDVLSRNTELIAIDERQLTTKEILAHPNLDSIKDELIRRKRLSFVMQSYPKQVEWVQRHLHVGMHSHDAPLSCDALHDFVEVRNVIVHAGGHASQEYLERTKAISVRRMPREYSSPKVDFIELVDFAGKILAQAEFVDGAVATKWQTTRKPS